MEKYFDVGSILYYPERHHCKCSEGKDPCLIVTRFTTHWKFYCHRCGMSGIKKIGDLPPEEVVKLWHSNRISKDRGRQVVKQMRLPEDVTNDIHTYAMSEYLWLQTAGITDEEIVKYNICYSPYFERVIFPVYDRDDKLIYWQGRKVVGDGPKWLNVKLMGREDIYFEVDHQIRYPKGKAVGVVIVEDIISAIIVGRTCSSLALLGSYIPDSLILYLKDRVVYIWLDKDKQGDAVKHFMRLQSHGIKAKLRVTKRDPKHYSEDDIKSIILKGGQGG